MSAESIDNRNEMLEWFFISVLFFAGLCYVVYQYYIDVWFFVKYWLYSGLSYVPEFIRNIVFFYSDEVKNLIVPIQKDLVFHSGDYPYYYTETTKGLGKQHDINSVTSQMVYPFLMPPILYVIIKESFRKHGQIDKPGRPNAMYSYAKTQMEIWPYIKPVALIMRKISKQGDLDSDWFAMAKMPIMWLKSNDLLFSITKSRRSSITQSQRKQFSLNRRKLYLALTKNLDRPWRGVDDLTYNERCLFAVIVPHIYGQIQTSRLLNRWLSSVNMSYGDEKIDVKYNAHLKQKIDAEVDRVIDLYREHFEMPFFDGADFEEPFDPLANVFEELDSEKAMAEKGKKAIKQVLLTHGYVKTVFFALLERSWEFGVLAPAELLWVKKIDRELYYVMSQQGRLSCFVDCSGAWAHYLYESTCGFKLISPQVTEAIRAFDYDLFKTHSNYFPHEDWDDQSKWDRLVPDFGKKGTLPSPKSTSATADVM